MLVLFLVKDLVGIPELSWVFYIDPQARSMWEFYQEERKRIEKAEEDLVELGRACWIPGSAEQETLREEELKWWSSWTTRVIASQLRRYVIIWLRYCCHRCFGQAPTLQQNGVTWDGLSVQCRRRSMVHGAWLMVHGMVHGSRKLTTGG